MGGRKLIRVSDLRARNNTGSTKNGWFIRDIGFVFYWYKGNGWYHNPTRTRKIVVKHHFQDWQNPTKSEVQMFELSTGIRYITHYLGIDEDSLP